MGRVGLPWIIHGVTDELISECASIFLKSSMVSFVWIGGHVHTKSVGAGRRVGKCLIPRPRKICTYPTLGPGLFHYCRTLTLSTKRVLL